MIKKYRKKPVVIEALQWTGDNVVEITEFMRGAPYDLIAQKQTITEIGVGTHTHLSHFDLVIHTLEGEHNSSIGDYIIKGIAGEFYPCKPDIFQKTYEEV